MSDLISFVQSAFQSPVNSIITILLFIAAIRGTYEIVKWAKGELNNWYNNKQQEEDEIDEIENRLSILENENKRQFEKLDSIDGTLVQITATLDKMAEENRANMVATCRSALWRLYIDFENRDSITSAEYETFMDLADRYLKNNGNSVFKDKIIPYVKTLSIKD